MRFRAYVNLTRPQDGILSQPELLGTYPRQLCDYCGRGASPHMGVPIYIKATRSHAHLYCLIALANRAQWN